MSAVHRVLWAGPVGARVRRLAGAGVGQQDLMTAHARLLTTAQSLRETATSTGRDYLADLRLPVDDDEGWDSLADEVGAWSVGRCVMIGLAPVVRPLREVDAVQVADALQGLAHWPPADLADLRFGRPLSTAVAAGDELVRQALRHERGWLGPAQVQALQSQLRRAHVDGSRSAKLLADQLEDAAGEDVLVLWP